MPSFSLTPGGALRLSPGGLSEDRIKADCASCLTGGAICDIFTILAHSNRPRGGASRSARHPASRQGPSWASNALVLADTRERSRTVARSKHEARGATHDASLTNSGVHAIRRVEHSVLGDGAVRTLQQGRRDATGELQTRICVGCSRQSGISEWSMLLHSTWPRSSLRKWQYILPAKRDRRSLDLHSLVGRRRDHPLMST